MAKNYQSYRYIPVSPRQSENLVDDSGSCSAQLAQAASPSFQPFTIFAMERPSPVGRPNLGGAGRHSQQYRLIAETVDKKLAIVAYYERHGMRATVAEFYRSLADEFYESKRTTTLRWRRDRPKLLAAAAAGKGSLTKIRGIGVGTILSNEQELDVVRWVNKLRDDSIPVSSRMLTDKAREVAAEAKVDHFRASDKWVVGFKRHHHFNLRAPTRQGQICPADINDVAAAFASTVEATVHDLGVRRVFNANQTGK